MNKPNISVPKIEPVQLIKKIPFKVSAYRFIRKVLIGFILASLINFGFSYFFHTPKVYRLGKENSELLIKYKVLQDKIEAASVKLEEITTRDKSIYRSIFAIDTIGIPSGTPLQWAGKEYKDNRYNNLIQEAMGSLNLLREKLYYQTLSLDTLQYLAKDKELLAESVPAIWPLDKNKVRGHIGSYGYRIHPIFKTKRKHDGMDFAGPIGTPIYATADGTIQSAGRDGAYGISVTVNHNFGYKTRYAHLNKSRVVMGQRVKRGEMIGELGNTGRSTGPHLHYEVIYKGNTVNPINYIGKDMKDEDFRKIVEAAREITYEHEQ